MQKQGSSDSSNDYLVKMYQSQVENNPCADSYINLGNAYTYINNYEFALENFRKSLSFDSTKVEIYVKIASCYIKQNNFNSALKYLDKGIRISANNSELNYCLGNTYFGINDFQKADTYYTKALNLGYDKKSCYISLSLASDKLGNKKKANQYIQKYNKASNSTSEPSTSVSTDDVQENFKKWLLNNTSVTEVRFESNYQIWITLSTSNYTSEENVKEIAKTIAKWYAQKMEQFYTVCTVWRGNDIYAKGSYSR